MNKLNQDQLNQSEEMNNDNQNCVECEFVKTVKKHTDDLSTASKQVLDALLQLQREHRGNRYIHVSEDMLDPILVGLDKLNNHASGFKIKGKEEPKNYHPHRCVKYSYIDLGDMINRFIIRLYDTSRSLIVDFFQLQRELRNDRCPSILENEFTDALIDIEEMCTRISKLKELLCDDSFEYQMYQ